jgi:hypothetical protein
MVDLHCLNGTVLIKSKLRDNQQSHGSMIRRLPALHLFIVGPVVWGFEPRGLDRMNSYIRASGFVLHCYVLEVGPNKQDGSLRTRLHGNF